MASTTYYTHPELKELSDDEIELIQTYRRAKKIRNSEITIAIQDGKRMKLWLTEKRR